MNEHTPGTWTVERLGNGFFTIIVRDGNDRYEGATIASEVCNGEANARLIAASYPQIPDNCRRRCNGEANARLIAAALELLEACQFALKYLEYVFKETGDAIPGDNCFMLRQAIAKANGNSHAMV